MITYKHSALGVRVDLNSERQRDLAPLTGSDSDDDMLTNFENIQGSDNDDSLKVNNKHNIIDGLNGDDVLNGNGGTDRLFGGSGKDVFQVQTFQTNVYIEDFIQGQDIIDLRKFQFIFDYANNVNIYPIADVPNDYVVINIVLDTSKKIIKILIFHFF